MRGLRAWPLVLLLLACPALAEKSLLLLGSEDETTIRMLRPVRSGFFGGNVTAARGRSMGFSNGLQLGYRSRLPGPVNGLLPASAFVALSATTAATPALARGGAQLDIQPLSFLRLSAQYEQVHYFGALSQLPSLSTMDALANDGELAAAVRHHDGRDGADGHQISVIGLLQGQLGPLAMRSLARLSRYSLALRSGEAALYEPYSDVRVENRGWFYVNDIDAVYVSRIGFTAGVRYTLTHAFYTENVGAGPAALKAQSSVHRVGPLLAYTFSEHAESGFNAPTLFLVANAWRSHPHRTGPMPYAVLGFSFRIDP